MTNQFIAAGAELKLLAKDLSWTEGPLWLPEQKVFIFSDIYNNRVMSVTEDGDLAVFEDQAEFTNGRTIDIDGSVLECSHGRRALQRRLLPENTTEIIVDSFNGVRLNSPNDVIVANDDAIWFSDPAYGIELPEEGHPGEREYGDRWVFRYDRQTKQLWPVITDIHAPNGLAFSPDESLLYVCDSSFAVGENGPGRHIRVYDMVDGRLAKFGRTIIEIDDAVPDGIRVDKDGNIWSSAGDGVRVYTPDGELLHTIKTPNRVSNLCWGGDDGHTLFICVTDEVYSIRTTTTDAVWDRFH